MEAKTDRAAIDGETRVAISPGVHARASGPEVVVLHFGRGEYFTLAGIGSAVWSRLERGESLGAIAASIATEHDVAPDVALKDVVAFVSDMLREGLVVRS